MMEHQGLVVFAGGPSRDPGLAFGSNDSLLVGVMFFPSSSHMGVMLFPSSVRRWSHAKERIRRGRCT